MTQKIINFYRCKLILSFQVKIPSRSGNCFLDNERSFVNLTLIFIRCVVYPINPQTRDILYRTDFRKTKFLSFHDFNFSPINCPIA